MISEAFAQKALAVALSKGGDFAELFLQDSESNSLSMTNGSPENATSSRKCGCGVRVLRGTKYIYTYTAGLSENAILSAAEAAADAAEDEKITQKNAGFSVKKYGFEPKIAAQSFKNDARIKLMSDAHKAAKAEDARISQVKVSVADTDSRVLVCNSEGVFAFDRRPRVRFRVLCVASDGKVLQTGTCAPGSGGGYEFFEKTDVAELGKKAAREALTLLSACDCPAGVFPVVIDGGFGGVIFHEACGHSLETTAVSRGNSEFCGKVGQKIASDRVSAVDDGTLSGEWGSICIDDEGHLSQRNLLIENGILKGYLSDILGARRMGISSSGSGRRQDYTFAPTSRMTNTFICAGEDDEEEMIKSMQNGLYAKTMGGGSVDPLTGEFNFAVNEGWWVKNGSLLCPVRGASLVGKGSEILLNIDRVGKTVTMAAGVCGSVSGNVPTNVGQPRIRVSSITVGGKGEML